MTNMRRFRGKLFYTDHMLVKLLRSLAMSNGSSVVRLSSWTAALPGVPKESLCCSQPMLVIFNLPDG